MRLPTTRRDAAVLSCFIGYAILAVYLYRPFTQRPFDMVDFSEFLPILRANDALGSRLVGMARYYAEQGRLNLVGYFFIASKWTVFGDNTVGWQVLRAAQMLGLTVLTYALLRRLNISASGAVIGAGLMVVSAPAARAWLRLTMAEPFGSTAIIGAALIGTYYQRSEHWRRLGLCISALVALTLLTKELLVAAVPIVLFISWTLGPDGWFERPRLSRRNVELFVLTTLVGIGVLAPSVVVALHASSDAYVSAYGRVGAGPLDLVRLELFTLIPFVPIGDPTPPGLMVAGVCYFGLLAIGLKLFADTVPSRRHFLSILAVGLAYPLLGAVIYLPWPAYQWFYSVPYLLGPSLLLGAAITGLERVIPRLRVLGYLAAGCILANMASDAALLSRRTEASQFLVSAAADLVSSASDTDSVFVAARELPQQAWQGFGQTLARYARATGRSFPPTVDVSCDEAARRSREPARHTTLIVFSTHCPRVGSAPVALSRSFMWPDWGHGAIRHDSIWVAAVVDTTARRLDRRSDGPIR